MHYNNTMTIHGMRGGCEQFKMPSMQTSGPNVGRFVYPPQYWQVPGSGPIGDLRLLTLNGQRMGYTGNNIAAYH